MAGGRKIKCVTSDPRWRDMVIKYRYNFTRLLLIFSGCFPPTSSRRLSSPYSKKGAEPLLLLVTVQGNRR
ncbi:hypothetical protein HZS98_23145 (plasmid) [Shigella flexneri]|nr:hypothetical protein HZS98_23145 [Shigella flexneri]